MNIRRRKYVVEVFGRTYTIGLFVLVLAYCYHSYKDNVFYKKGSPQSNFRVLGSYVSFL